MGAVSKDVEREESYSGESEPEVPAKGKTTAKKAIPPAPARKPSLDSNKGSSASIGSGGAKPAVKKVEAKKAGQSTLAGFFKKK
jgi:DNA polymerase delta subunit 3